MGRGWTDFKKRQGGREIETKSERGRKRERERERERDNLRERGGEDENLRERGKGEREKKEVEYDGGGLHPLIPPPCHTKHNNQEVATDLGPLEGPRKGCQS